MSMKQVSGARDVVFSEWRYPDDLGVLGKVEGITDFPSSESLFLRYLESI